MRSTASWRRALRSAVVLALLSSVAPPLAAQELFGTMRRDIGGDGSTTRPASGVVIIVERATDSRPVARAITGEAGTWRLRVTTDSLRVRALRIGQEPVDVAELRLADGEVRDLSTVLLERPVQLATLQTRSNNRCPVDPRNARRVARLFADARTALVASQLASVDGRPRSRFRVMTSEWNAREDRLLGVRTVEAMADSTNPFRSVPADSLALIGFVTIEPDRSTVWRAPDAAVLTDDAFLAEYCLTLVEDDSSGQDRIGVGFRPARNRRDIVQIEGVLWLDRATSRLRRLDFGYVGLNYLMRDAAPRGHLRFTQLPEGLWLVHEWALRMPVIARRVSLVRDEVMSGASLRGITELHAEVLEVAVGAQRRYTVGAADWLNDSGAVMTAAIDEPRVASCPADRGTVLGTLRGADATPLHDGRVQVRSLDRPDRTVAASASTDAAGRFVLCDLDRDALLLARFDADGHRTDSVTLRVTESRGIAVVDWLLRDREVAALEDIAMPPTNSGIVDPVAALLQPRERAPDPASVGAPLPGLQLQVRDTSGRALGDAVVQFADGTPRRTDSLGVVMLPVDASLSLAVRIMRVGFSPLADTVRRRAAGEPFVAVLQPAPSARLARTDAGDGARLRVVDRDGVPIPFAMVSVAGRAPRAANAEGEVPLPDDRRPDWVVRVQRIGYAPHDGRLGEVAAGGSVMISMAPLGPTLSEVRTIAPRETMLSRTGFYDRLERVRRGAFVATFLSPEELEQRAAVRISSVLVGQPYVTVDRGRLYGRGGCRMQLVLDGKLIEGNTPDDLISSSEVMAIEVYPSTANAPVELIPVTYNGSCGIVAFWTGPRR